MTTNELEALQHMGIAAVNNALRKFQHGEPHDEVCPVCKTRLVVEGFPTEAHTRDGKCDVSVAEAMRSSRACSVTMANA